MSEVERSSDQPPQSVDPTRPAPEAPLEETSKALKETPETLQEAESDAPPQTQREVWLEVAVVFMITLFPLFSAALLHWFLPERDLGSETPGPSLPGSLARLRIVLPQCVFVLYIMWRSGEPWSHFGVKRLRWFQDTFLVGATNFLHYWILTFVTIAFFQLIGKPSLGTHGPGPGFSVNDPTDFTEPWYSLSS